MVCGRVLNFNCVKITVWYYCCQTWHRIMSQWVLFLPSLLGKLISGFGSVRRNHAWLLLGLRGDKSVAHLTHDVIELCYSRYNNCGRPSLYSYAALRHSTPGTIEDRKLPPCDFGWRKVAWPRCSQLTDAAREVVTSQGCGSLYGRKSSGCALVAARVECVCVCVCSFFTF